MSILCRCLEERIINIPKKIKLFILISILLLTVNVLFADSIRIRKTSFDETEYIFSSQLYGYEWISLNHFFKTFGNEFDIDNDEWVIKIVVKDKNIMFYGGSAFYKIDGKLYHLPTPIERLGNGLYIPFAEFMRILKIHFYNKVEYKKEIDTYILSPAQYSLGAIKIKDLKNGTMIQIETDRLFKKKHCKIWNDNGWLYFTVFGANIDIEKTIQEFSLRDVRKIDAIQAKESVQLSFKFRYNISSYDFDINEESNTISISVRKETVSNAEKNKDMRSKWLIDTIVLDAGHGGKSPGTCYGRLKEKDIVLDIVLKLGKLLEKYLDVKVVYTRKTDKSVPLWKRTQMANESDGKLFVSVHVNGIDNSSATFGTETYILAPRGTEQAIEIASKENSVIQLEKNQGRYKDILSPQQYILATMAQREFMKESQELAQLVETQYSSRLRQSKSRGLRQAGFIVLIGASMPCILTEVGFITNRNERINLARSSYRNKIALSLYYAIKKFKIEQDKKITDS